MSARMESELAAADEGEYSDAALTKIIEETRARLAELDPCLDEAERLRAVIDILFPDAPRSETVVTIGDVAQCRLAELAPLVEEAKRLHAALAALAPEAVAQADPAGGHVPARKAQILAIIAAEPGITVAEIAGRHGMKRTVVASSVSRLKRCGELVDSGGGLRLPGA